MRKKFILLPLTGLMATGTAFGFIVANGRNLAFANGASTTYYHYEAVEATCVSYGIKEYWTDCRGDTVIEKPEGAAIIEKGQPSAADIQFIIDTYGASDERIIAKSDTHGALKADPNCLGRQLCTLCGEPVAESAIPTLDFVTNGFYGMYDWYVDHGVADPSWVFTNDPSSISFYTYGYDKYTRVRLPNIYYAGFDCVTIDLTIANKDEKYSFVPDRSVNFVVPSANYSTKLVFSNITSSSMDVTLRDSSNSVLLSISVTDQNIINGNDGFMIYIDCVGLGTELLSNFTFIKDCEHNFVADTLCIGKEICSSCYAERGVAAPVFDFTQNLYGANTIYEPWGSVPQDGWARGDNAGSVSLVNYQDGQISIYGLPRIYFAGFSKITIDVVVNYSLVKYALDHDFTSEFQTPFAVYSLKVVFDDITSSSMTVKIQDAFGTTQVQGTCNDVSVLNGLSNYQMFVKGSGNVGWDAFSNFTFTA